jgi:hypothetical protein
METVEFVSFKPNDQYRILMQKLVNFNSWPGAIAGKDMLK